MGDNIRGKIVYIFLNPIRRQQRYYALDLDNDDIIKQGTFQNKTNEIPAEIISTIAEVQPNKVEIIGNKHFCTKLFTLMQTKFNNNKFTIEVKEHE